MSVKKNKKAAKSNPDLVEVKFTGLADDIISQAKKMGATAVEVDADVSSGFSVNVRNE